MKFTDDPLVRESLRFLMTREIAHFQQFSAALRTVQPNFPPGVLQGDPRFTNAYFNMSNGASARGPWNEGEIPLPGRGEWTYIENPVEHVIETEGLVNQEETDSISEKETASLNKQLSKTRSTEVKSAMPIGEQQWSDYPQEQLEAPLKKVS